MQQVDVEAVRLVRKIGRDGDREPLGVRRTRGTVCAQARQRLAVDAFGIMCFAGEVGVEVGDLGATLHHLGVGAEDVREFAVQAERNRVLDLGIAQHRTMHAAHDELEVRDVVLLVLADHEEFALRAGGAVQAVSAVEHEDLERGDPVLLDQHVDLADVRAIERREVVGVVHPETVLRQFEHLRVDLGVGAAALHVIAAGAHVVEARGHATLRGREALAVRVLGQRPVDARMHVRIDESREGQATLPIDDLLRVCRSQPLGHLDDLAALHGDIHLFHGGLARAHHFHVLDEEVVLLRLVGHELPRGGR